MKIEIWSDFTCPLCYIGKRRLELALEQFGQKEYIEIEYKSFQLDPKAACTGKDTEHKRLMEKYGPSVAEGTDMIEYIINQGKEVGLHFQFEKVAHTNTFHAHRLVKHAIQSGKADLLVECLFENYFIHHKNIGNRDVLFSLAGEVGLDAAETDALLCLNKHSKTVSHDEDLARELGIKDVPFFIFNEIYAVAGAQPMEVFLNVLHELWLNEAEATIQKEKDKEAYKRTYCTGNECEVE